MFTISDSNENYLQTKQCLKFSKTKRVECFIQTFVGDDKFYLQSNLTNFYITYKKSVISMFKYTFSPSHEMSCLIMFSFEGDKLFTIINESKYYVSYLNKDNYFLPILIKEQDKAIDIFINQWGSFMSPSILETVGNELFREIISPLIINKKYRSIVVELLDNYNGNYNFIVKRDGWSYCFLKIAILQRNIQLIKFFCDQENINLNIYCGIMTPVALCVYYEYVEGLKILLERGADQTICQFDYIPIREALLIHNEEIVKLLTDNGSDPSIYY